jgi:hypothetical protein
MPPKKRPSAATDASASTGKDGSKKPRVSAAVPDANSVQPEAVPGAAAKAAFVPKAFVKLYRTTPVGKALTESLDELLQGVSVGCHHSLTQSLNHSLTHSLQSGQVGRGNCAADSEPV